MSRHERILNVPSVTITEQMAKSMGEKLHALAEARITEQIITRLRDGYRGNQAQAQLIDPGATSEDEFITRNVVKPEARQWFYPQSAEKFTFLSPHGSILFEGSDFKLDDIPRDLNSVLARADGPNTSFIDINLKARFENYFDLYNKNQNRVLIQSTDSTWVNAAYEEIRMLIQPGRNVVRNLLYKNLRIFTWITFAVLVVFEYRLAHYFFPSFNYSAPLSGLGVLTTVLVLFLDFLIVGNGLIPFVGFLYPYFEIEKNLSRYRLAWRLPITIAATALYGAIIKIIFWLK